MEQGRQELPSLMEPLLIGQGFRSRPMLTDLALELTGCSGCVRLWTAMAVWRA